ncbi:MAG: GNAT family N-acetyltransferase [Defluviitaleaceae bacterium]|nr:GNAT family N-acetyltransferase [Defluviitaleaceae bacterium]
MNPSYTLHFAEPKDTSHWMDFVDAVKDNFPGFNRNEYLDLLERNIQRKSALCVKHHGKIVGILLFSVNAKCLSFMAVHPSHRKQGIGLALVEQMIALFPDNVDIAVSTFRENDPLGDAPRALYKKAGFVEDELCIGIGEYPVQKFILRKMQPTGAIK